MAKTKQATEATAEKKLRRRLQRAEAAHIKTQQALEAARTRLSKAASRLERRATALGDARERLAAHAASTRPPAPDETPAALARAAVESQPGAATDPAEPLLVDPSGEPLMPRSRPRRGRKAAPEGLLTEGPENGVNGASREATPAGDDGPLGIVVP